MAFEHFDNSHSLEEKYPFLSILHPEHIAYIKYQPINSLNYLLGLLDRLDSEKRFRILYFAFDLILLPSKKEFEAGEKPPKAIENSEATYAKFKQRCREISEVVVEYVLVSGLVNMTLSNSFFQGNLTSIEETKERATRITEKLMKEPKAIAFGEPHDRFTRQMVGHIESIPERVQEGYSLYTYFCENVLKELFNESKFDTHLK